MKILNGLSAAACVIVLGGVGNVYGLNDPVCLVTRSVLDPFSTAIRNGAFDRAKEANIDFLEFNSNDLPTQISAIEQCISKGSHAILLVAHRGNEIVPTVKKAREAGTIVIAAGVPLIPPNAADATFATETFKAGAMIGAWTATQIGDRMENTNIVMLDDTKTIANALGSDGFRYGYDLEAEERDFDNSNISMNVLMKAAGDSSSVRTQMKELADSTPNLTVLHATNHSAEVSALNSLKEFDNRNSILVASTEGDCSSIQSLKEGLIDVVALENPRIMGAVGMEAIIKWSEEGIDWDSVIGALPDRLDYSFAHDSGKIKSENPVCKIWPEICTEQVAFYDTGVTLVANGQIPGENPICRYWPEICPGQSMALLPASQALNYCW